jgi:hypothetical protein
MTTLQLREILKSLAFTSNVDLGEHVLLARHASEAHSLFMRDLKIFEEYQRFQTDDNFGKCKYVVSFIGLPGKGQAATFAGIYKVTGKHLRGQVGFRDPVGDPEFVAKWKHQDFLYDLSRLKEFDFLQLAWDIQWNLPGPAKYQYLKPDLPIEVLRFDSCNDIGEVKLIIKSQILEEDSADEISQGAAEFSEGAPYYTKHLRRERSSELVKLVKDNARKTNTYCCCVCEADFQKSYGVEYIECHHTVPVSTLALGEKTKIEDMVLLCANCHRAVHKREPWLEKHELHKLLTSSK